VCLFRGRAGPPIPTNLQAGWYYWTYLLAQGRREHWEPRKLVLLLVGCLLLFQNPAPAQVKEVRRVLVFNDFGSMSSPGFAAVDQAIAAGLEKSPYQIEFYNENLEATLFPEEASQRQFREWFAIKYRDRKPDVIIAAGQASLKFMVESHEKAFPNTPIIFCGSTEEMLHKLKLDSDFTGVWAVAQPEKTLKAALHLQPATKHVVVVGGVGTFDRDTEGIVRKGLRNYESTLDFTYLTDLVSRPGDFVSTNAFPRIGIGPAKRFRRCRVGSNVFPQFAGEIGNRGENAPGDDVALDLREPQLHLI